MAVNGIPDLGTPAVGLRLAVGENQVAEVKLPIPVTETMLFNLFFQLSTWYANQFVQEHSIVPARAMPELKD